jgi:hypothetical protein
VGVLSPDNADMQVRADDGTTILAETTVPEPDPDAPYNFPNRKRLIVELTDEGLEEGRYYLCVKRQAVEPLGFSIGWDTDLTVLHGNVVPGAGYLSMYCNTETDPGIDDLDEIYLNVRSDNHDFQLGTYLGQFDDDYPLVLDNIIPPLRFVNYVDIELWDSEEGEPYYGAPDYFIFSIAALPRSQREAFNQPMSIAYEDESSFAPDDAGEYSISYNLSRTLLK